MSKITLETVIQSRYGVSLISCDSIVVEWAAHHLATLTDVFVAGQAWRKAESKRNKLGKYTAIPGYNDPLYDAFTAKNREGYEMSVARRAKNAA